MAWQELLLVFPVLGWMWVGDKGVAWLGGPGDMGPVLPHQEEEEGCGAGWCWRDFPVCSFPGAGSGCSTPSAWIKIQSPARLQLLKSKGRAPARVLHVGTALSPCPELLLALGGSYISCSFGLFIFFFLY